MARQGDLLCLIVSILYLHPAWVASRTTNLFGADPAGGLWSAEVEENGMGGARFMERVGISKNAFPSQIISASYDASSHRVLVETKDPHKISYAPICQKKAEAPRDIVQIGDTSPLKHHTWGDCVNCKTSAFTLFESKIYFLVVGEYFTSDDTAIHRVGQIRHFLPCAECNVHGSGRHAAWQYVDTVNCSSLVVEIFHQTFTPDTLDYVEIRGGKNMVISRNTEGNLDFFFHLGNITAYDSREDQVYLSLWHASSARGGQATDLLHEHSNSRFSAWSMSALGSVDYKDGTLCWTTGLILKCADWSGSHGLTHIKELMTPAQAYIDGICSGSDTDKLSLVSGVSVLKGGDHRVVSFGCYPDVAGEGGTGIVRLGRTHEHGNLYPIADGNRKFQAGAMFSHRTIQRKCSFGEELPICLGPPTTTTQPPTTTTQKPVTRPKDDPCPGGQNCVPDPDKPKPDPEKPGQVVQPNDGNSRGGCSGLSSTVHTVLAIILPLCMLALL